VFLVSNSSLAPFVMRFDWKVYNCNQFVDARTPLKPRHSPFDQTKPPYAWHITFWRPLKTAVRRNLLQLQMAGAKTIKGGHKVNWLYYTPPVASLARLMPKSDDSAALPSRSPTCSLSATTMCIWLWHLPSSIPHPASCIVHPAFRISNRLHFQANTIALGRMTQKQNRMAGDIWTSCEKKNTQIHWAK